MYVWIILENLKRNSDHALFCLYTLSLECYPSIRCYSVRHPHAAHHHVPECCVLVLVNISVELTEECPNILKCLRWKLFAVVTFTDVRITGHCKVQIRATLFNRQILPVPLHVQQILPMIMPMLLLLPLSHRQCRLMQLLRPLPRSHTGWWR